MRTVLILHCSIRSRVRCLWCTLPLYFQDFKVVPVEVFRDVAVLVVSVVVREDAEIVAVQVQQVAGLDGVCCRMCNGDDSVELFR